MPSEQPPIEPTRLDPTHPRPLETEQPEPSAAESLEQSFQLGQAAFERGLYREAVAYLMQAMALCDRNSRLGGDLQIWLVTAYDAAGHRETALSLCRQLHQHPYGEIRKQSKRLSYILEAPKLATRPEWLTQIPDLEQVSDPDRRPRIAASTTKPPEPQRFIPSEPVDPNQVNTEDSGFVWVALGAITLILMGIIWLS